MLDCFVLGCCDSKGSEETLLCKMDRGCSFLQLYLTLYRQVASESYKFCRLYPLSPTDLPDAEKVDIPLTGMKTLMILLQEPTPRVEQGIKVLSRCGVRCN